MSRSVRDGPIWRNVLLLLLDGNSEVSGRDARMSDDDPSKVNIESTTRTLHPDYHGSNVQTSASRLFNSLGRVSHLRIFIDWNEMGREWSGG